MAAAAKNYNYRTRYPMDSVTAVDSVQFEHTQYCSKDVSPDKCENVDMVVFFVYKDEKNDQNERQSHEKKQQEKSPKTEESHKAHERREEARRKQVKPTMNKEVDDVVSDSSNDDKFYSQMSSSSDESDSEDENAFTHNMQKESHHARQDKESHRQETDRARAEQHNRNEKDFQNKSQQQPEKQDNNSKEKDNKEKDKDNSPYGHPQSEQDRYGQYYKSENNKPEKPQNDGKPQNQQKPQSYESNKSYDGKYNPNKTNTQYKPENPNDPTNTKSRNESTNDPTNPKNRNENPNDPTNPKGKNANPNDPNNPNPSGYENPNEQKVHQNYPENNPNYSNTTQGHQQNNPEHRTQSKHTSDPNTPGYRRQKDQNDPQDQKDSDKGKSESDNEDSESYPNMLKMDRFHFEHQERNERPQRVHRRPRSYHPFAQDYEAEEDDWHSNDYKYKPNEAVKKFDEAFTNSEFGEYMKKHQFKPKSGKYVCMDVVKCEKFKTMTVFGMGKNKTDCPAKASKMGQCAAECVAASKCKSAHFIFPEEFSSVVCASKFMESFYVACTPQNSYYSDAESHNPYKNCTKVKYTFGVKTFSYFNEMVNYAANMATGVCYAREMTSAPPNYCTPESVATMAIAVAEKVGLECKVMDQSYAERENMGAFTAMSKGSAHPPKFVHMKYQPKGQVYHTMAVVGSGVSYDSGGYNMKKEKMETQKFDMAGAAAVIASAYCVGMMKPENVECHFIIAAGENMVSSKSCKPGDVVTVCDGTTVEVKGTDSAACMAMADAVAYTKKYTKAQCIVEMSNTGNNPSDTVGKKFAPVYFSNVKMFMKYSKSAYKAGEGMWPFVFATQDENYNKSYVADKSTGDSKKCTKGDASFIKSFAGKTPFAHVEMQGPASNSYTNQSTGYGVCSYVQYVNKMSQYFNKKEKSQRARNHTEAQKSVKQSSYHQRVTTSKQAVEKPQAKSYYYFSSMFQR